MNTCYRTLCYGTSIKKTLRGSFFDKDQLDLVLVKNYSLEYMHIQTTSGDNGMAPGLLHSIFEQQTFGSILDGKKLSCTFQEEEEEEQSINNSDTMHQGQSRNECILEEQHRYTQKTRTGHTRIQGNDLLALLSEYGQLVFCTVVGQQANLTGTGRFECVAEITLDEPGLDYTKVNKKLAIDPWSRAIAIASYQDRVDIMVLNDSMSRTHFSPINGMGSIEEKGIIWHMEFLQTETGSWDRILLAIVVYNDIDRVCRIIVYSIDASDPQKASIKLVGRLPLDRKTPLPVLLFPLPCYHESFIVATERSVCVLSADDIACGNVLYPVIWTPGTLFGSDTDQEILITSYSLSADPSLPLVYLGTAEGYLLKLDIADLSDIKWIPCQKLHPMGQDMCMLGLIELDNGNGGSPFMAEALLYVGESADSQVIGITWDSDDSNKVTPFVLQTLVNRAPLTNWQVVRKNGQPDTIVCCSGQDEQGALHYLSRDVDSTILCTSNMDWNGITKLWCLGTSMGRDHLVASSSYESRCVFIDNVDRMDEDTPLRMETEATIFAGSLLSSDFKSVFVQVTQKKIIFCSPDGDLLLEYSTPNGFSIALGTAWTEGESMYVSICVSDGGDYILQVLTISPAERNSALEVTQQCQIPLPSSPSCIYYFSLTEELGHESNVMAIGMYDSSVSLYSLDSRHQLVIRQAIGCHDIPHSLAIIGSLDLLCLLVGTRSGGLCTFGITPTQSQKSSPIFGQGKMRSVGDRPVDLASYRGFGGFGPVFASCDSLWRIDYDNDSHMTIEAVHIPGVTTVETSLLLGPSYDQEQQGRHQKLAIVANRQLYVIQVQDKGQIMTRKQVLATTPRKLLLHDQSTSYLVMSSNHRGKIYYQLQLIDKSGRLLCEHRFDYGETVLCLSKWQVQNKNKVYHYVCVGIVNQDFTQAHGSRAQHDQEGSGSLHLYRLKAHKSGTPNSLVQYSIRLAWKNDGLRGGVHTICPHPSGLLFSSGNILHLHQLDMAKGALKNITHKTLRFPITSIHVAGDRICVTGHTESASFYAYDEETMHLSFLKSDSISRNVHHSLLLNNRTVVGVSHSGGMFALKEVDDDLNYNDDTLKTLFCFHYPDTIIQPRLLSLRSYHSTEYTGGILSDHLLPWTTLDEDNDKTTPKPDNQQHEVQPIVGCTISGGVIMAYRCSARLFAALDTLQQCLSRYILTQPLLGSTARYSRWYNELSGPQVSTVHLDLVSMYSRLTAKQQQEVVRLSGDAVEGTSDNNDTRVLTLVELTMAVTENTTRRHFCYSSMPNWTQQPDVEKGDDLITWTALTLNLLITKLDQYYC